MTRERFILLLEREQEGLLKFLLALCDGNYPEAEDLAQETSLKAYLSYRGYVENFKFSTWLYRIAYNGFIDHKRKKSIPTEPLEAGINIEGSERHNRMEYEGLYSAIEGLPLDEKAAILLFYMEDMKIIDIAIVMRKPIGTVKSYLNRGRNHLKEKLRDE
ncbi:MAG: RNA polymerase sigma factor [Bacteroidales bacterium]|nr:RNA polymerase sigma factor [Bacteroidales bacterium]